MHIRTTAIILSGALLISACGTLTTETTTLPFDVASTSGDVASTASGTTGGEDSSSVAVLRFIESELAWIRRDAARGGGEYLDALAELMNESDPQQFAKSLQSNYPEIFVAGADAAQVYENIQRLRQG